MKETNTQPKQPTAVVKKTDAEWKKLLTAEQYRIARKAGTEAPHGAVYKQWKKQAAGTYYCVACNAELFHSSTKFDVRCGWPAFYDGSKHENIKTKEDLSGGRKRVEVLCAKCDAHLGHVFEGEGFNTPTDKRYCINGIVLTFVPDTPTQQIQVKEDKNKEKQQKKSSEDN